MPTEQYLNKRLTDVLFQVEFATRYYGLCRAHVSGTGRAGASKDEVKAALAASGLEFAFQSRGKFFRHTETRDGLEFELNVAVPGQFVEFILSVRTTTWGIGDTFAGLAFMAARRADLSFNPSPPWPVPKYLNLGELGEILGQGIALFRDVRDASSAVDDWDVE